MLPNFLFVGARKCGSTSLHQALNSHPDVLLSNHKETKFFVSARQFMRGRAFYELRYFDHWRRERAVGETDPEIIDAEGAPDRIRETLGRDVKLIFCFRHPVERAYSHYLHNVARFYEFDGFEVALQEDRKRRHMEFRYRRTSNYGLDLKPFLDVFPRQNCLFLIFEELYGPHGALVFRSVLEFLEIAPVNIELPHVRKRYLPTVRQVECPEGVWSRLPERQGRGTPHAVEVRAGDIVIEDPISGHRALRRPSNQTSILLRKYCDNRPPLRLSTSERNRLFETYFVDFIPLLEELIGRSLDLWRC